MHKQAAASLSRFILLLIFMIGMSACAGAAPTPPPATATSAPPTLTPSPVPPSPTQTSTVEPTPTAFIPKATVKIVVHVPLSGKYMLNGMDIRQAVQLALQQQEGPLNQMGYDVELVAFDDEADIDTAVANARQIVDDPEIMCGVGHYLSIITINASDFYHLAGLAFISPSNTLPKVTDRGLLEVNRVVGRDDHQGAAAAQFAQSRGFKSAFVVSTEDNYSIINANGFKRRAGELSLPLVGDFKASLRMGNFEAVVAHLLDSEAAIVNFSGPSDQAGAFIKVARQKGYQGAFIVQDGGPAILQAAGALALEGGGTFFTSQAAPASWYPGAAQFLLDFKSAFGHAPQIFAAQAYDAAGICLKAIQTASTSRAGELPTRTEVAQAIRAIHDYEGITGTFSFNTRGDLTPMQFFIGQVISADPGRWDENPIVESVQLTPE